MTDKISDILHFTPQQQTAEVCALKERATKLKLAATKMLNNVAAGTYMLTALNIEGINEINEMCLKVGIAPLEIPEPPFTKESINYWKPGMNPLEYISKYIQ